MVYIIDSSLTIKCKKIVCKVLQLRIKLCSNITRKTGINTRIILNIILCNNFKKLCFIFKSVNQLFMFDIYLFNNFAFKI